MAIHLITGKVGDGKSVENHKRKIHAELSALIGQRVNVSLHTGQAGLYISLNAELRVNATDAELFTVTIVNTPTDVAQPTNSACVSFSPARVNSIRRSTYGVIIDVL